MLEIMQREPVLKQYKRMARAREFLYRLVERTGEMDPYGARAIAKCEIGEKNQPMAEGIRKEKGFFETMRIRSRERVMNLNQSFLDWKRRKLETMGWEEQKLMDWVTLERAFRISKMISAIDIAQEIASFVVGAGCVASVASGAAYCYFKYGLPADFLEPLKEMWARLAPDWNPLHIISNVLKYSSYAELAGWAKFYAFGIVGLGGTWFAQSLLGLAGTGLDVAQHMWVDMIANAFPEDKKEKARGICRKFSDESIREQAVDNFVKHVLSWVPIVPVTLRRWVAVKSERRQMACVGEMHGLLREEEGAQQEIPLRE